MPQTSCGTIITWLEACVRGNGDSLPANDAHRTELSILKARLAAEGENDDLRTTALAALKDASAGRSTMEAVVASLS